MLDHIIANANKNFKANPSDYTGEDGLLRCGKCGGKKQHRLPAHHGNKIVACQCRCQREQDEAELQAEKAQEQREYIERQKAKGLTDRIYYSQTFANDDNANPRITDICKRYVKKWPEIKQNNIGLLFSGSVGTGKSFYASCIANALLDQGQSVLITTLPRLIMQMKQSEGEKQVIEQLQTLDLLVLDDLGVERLSDYTIEKIFEIIDCRKNSGKPMIVTTNLSVEDMKACDNEQQRIFDRLKETTPKVINVTGRSRRNDKAQEKVNLLDQILFE